MSSTDHTPVYSKGRGPQEEAVTFIDHTRHKRTSPVTNTPYKPQDESLSTSSSISCDDEKSTRHGWANKTEYILSMVGYCVGLGNVWRFPYVCIRNGGGAFLIPFFICLVLCGLPLYLTEVALGQFVSLGPLHAFNICPMFKGVGLAMNSLCMFCSWYYTIILAWTLIYMVSSFFSPLPWTRCDMPWNTPQCVTPDGRRQILANISGVTGLLNGTGVTGNVSDFVSGNVTGNAVLSAGAGLNGTTYTLASEEFWLRNVLQLSEGFEDMGGLPWKNVLALFVSTLVVYLCVIKGVETVGKVVYVTAVLPYLMLLAFLVKGLTLPGAMDGISYYLTPDFDKLFTVQTWLEACLQVFYSLGPGWGGLITMASYNKFNNNCMRDAVILTFVCEGTSVFAGFAIFSILGHMSYNLGVPVSTFSSSGPGLAFVVYPEAISYLPIPQFWGVLFFLMLFTIGLDSQFVTCEVILTTVYDSFPSVFKTGLRKGLFKVMFFIVVFLVSLPFAARGGMYLFQLVDWYFASVAVMTAGLGELIAVHWIYGSERFLQDIKLMIGYTPSRALSFVWRFVTPLMLVTILLVTFMVYTSPVYQGYVFTPSEVAFGWCLALTSFVPIPMYAAYLFLATPGSFRQRMKTITSPTEAWQPSDMSLRDDYRKVNRPRSTCTFDLPCCRTFV